MKKIGFIDIGEDGSYLFIFEEIKKGAIELRETLSFSYNANSPIALPDVSRDISEFYLSIPLDVLNFRIIETPFSDREKVMSILPFELDGLILGGVKEVVFDCVIAERGEDKSRVLAIYAKKDAIGNFMEGMKASNADPKIITALGLKNILKDFDPEKLFAPSPLLLSPEERAAAALAEINAPTFNLRKDEFSYTRDIEDQRRSLTTAVLFISIFLFLLSASLLTRIVHNKKEIGEGKREISKIFTEVFPGAKKEGLSLYQLQSRLKELRDKKNNLTGISPLNTLDAVSGVNRGNAVFSEMIFEKGRITLRGEAPTFSDVERLKQALFLVLEDASVADSKTSAQGNVFFSITAGGKKND